MDNTHKLIGILVFLIAIFSLFVTQPGGKLLGLQTAEPRYSPAYDMGTKHYPPPHAGGEWATPPNPPSTSSADYPAGPDYPTGPSTRQEPTTPPPSPSSEYQPSTAPVSDTPFIVQYPTISPPIPAPLPTQPLSWGAQSGSQPPSSAGGTAWPNPDPIEYGDAPYCYTEHEKECGREQSSAILYTCSEDPASGDLLWIAKTCTFPCQPSTINSQGDTIPARCEEGGQEEDAHPLKQQKCPPGVLPGENLCQGDDLYSCTADGTRLKESCAGFGCAPAETSWSVKEQQMVSLPAQCRVCSPGHFKSCVGTLYSTRGRQFPVKDKNQCNNRGTGFEVIPCNQHSFPPEYVGLETVYSCVEHDVPSAFPSAGPTMPSKEGRCECVDKPDPVAYCIQPVKSTLVYSCQRKDRTNEFDGKWGYCVGGLQGSFIPPVRNPPHK